ncbi:hypothetical protein BDY19DRAFT_995341 [Irpex rosettiformis]|uniref:Uncharacterized protein n=1 Tax=Irpex rosettiformis TaxID=378272 RepID=A0ACB8TXV6_9APHY|nr:hypothetical protein BDY19DRAFT_995341 [Irpex rosettiformis]
MYTWNTTVEDTSSLFDFRPYSEGSTSGGWASFFQDLGFWHGSPGSDSQGKDSVHITNFAGASVTLQFKGTAIYLYGTQNCSYSVTLDSQPTSIPFASSLPEGMLFYKEDMASTTHTISLTANPNEGQQLAFDKAVITNIGINASNINPVRVDNQNQTALHYDGKWTNQSSYNVPSDSSPEPYMSTTDPGDIVSMNFKGGVAVAINGARNWGHWTYNVSLDGVTSVYNASTWWLMGDALLFYQSNLDPGQTHTIQLANTGSPNDKLSLNYFTVYTPNATALDTSPSNSSSPSPGGSSPSQAPSSQSHSKTNIGVIVGPVVAGVVALSSILILFIWHRSRRQRNTLSTSINPLNPPPTSQSTTAVFAFPPNERPDVWVKGMEAGQPAPSIMNIQAVPPVVPHQGKRRRREPGNSHSASRSRNTHTPTTTPSSSNLIPQTHSTSHPVEPETQDPIQPASSIQASRSIPPTTSASSNSLPTATTATTAATRRPHPHPPTTAPAPAPQPPTVNVNVDHIIELLAQRLDSSGRGGALAVHNPDVPPPQYTA